MAVADEAFKGFVRDEVQSQLAAALSDVDVLGLRRQVLRLQGEVVELQARLALDTKAVDACTTSSCREAAPLQAEKGSYSPMMQEHANLPALPESMYSYCVSTLANSDRLWAEPAAWYLMLLSFSQQVLVHCMLHGFWTKRMKKGWDGSSGSSVYQCLFLHSPDPLNIKTIHGEVVEKIFGSVVVMVLTATLIKHDDEQALRCLYPSKESRLSIRCFVNVFWCIHCIYLPFFVAMVTSGLMAVSVNGMDVVMNSLVMAFVLEIDDFMYEHFLPNERKTAYQALTGGLGFGFVACESVSAAFVGRFQWLLSMCLMLAHYFFDEYMDSFFSGRIFVMMSERDDLWFQQLLALLILSCLGGRAWLQHIAWSGDRGQGGETGRAAFVCQSLGAVLLCLMAVCGYYGAVEHFLGASVFDAKLWLACLGD